MLALVADPSALSKTFVAVQVFALVLTVGCGIITHGHVLRVFTYYFDQKEKNEHNEEIERELQQCLADPRYQSEFGQQHCREMYRGMVE